MKMGILRVTAIHKPVYRTRIHVRSPWLASMGFVQGALVSVAPLQDGFTLAVHDKNCTLIKGKGSKFIHVGIENKKNNPVCQLGVYLTQNFSIPGLSAGDFLAAGYDYGTIEARKLPPADKYVVVASQDYSAYLRLSGGWLSDIGFISDTIVTVSLAHGYITLSVWKGGTATYSELVKFARKHKYQVIQDRKNQQVTILDITGYLLNSAGFAKGDIAGIHYEYGMIRLFKPDLQLLGF